jgi:amidase
MTPLLERTASAADSFSFVEATIPQLQSAMAAGQLSSRDLTIGYLQRIQSLNPTLHAVIEVNPNAVSMAAGLDNERRKGVVRGPLHGIPILWSGSRSAARNPHSFERQYCDG